jgi:hypothetical protein
MELTLENRLWSYPMADTATTRTELREMLEAQVDRWAMKAEHYPKDQPKEQAIEILQRLAETVKDVPQSMIDAYRDTFFRWDHENYGLEIALLRDDALQEVGFYTAPENAEAWIRDFLDRVAWDQRRNVYKPTIVP